MRERIIRRMPPKEDLFEVIRLAMEFFFFSEPLYLLQQFSFCYDPFLLQQIYQSLLGIDVAHKKLFKADHFFWFKSFAIFVFKQNSFLGFFQITDHKSLPDLFGGAETLLNQDGNQIA